MSGGCDQGCSLDKLRDRQRGTLRVVLAINAVMFFVIVAAAAGAVWFTGSGWPDIAVASCLVLFLMRSAIRVLFSARAELHVVVR